ncbi:MAG: ThuA domain-containing protein [Pseudomonadota bacterium]
MTAGVITYTPQLNALVSVRGHPFERDAFGDVFADMEGVATSFVDQPAASQLMNPDSLAAYDALVLYDMPGLDFMHPDAPGYVEPSIGLKEGLAAALDKGIGVVAMHHAIAGWPAWPEYGDWLGGRFLYRPGDVRGASSPDSGYRHEVTHTISASPNLADVFTPLVEGVDAPFQLKDELYLSNVFEDDVFPLWTSDHVFEDRGFYSASLAVQGDMFSNKGWSHPKGSNLVGWVKRAGNSPLVYLQFGDGPETYSDPNFKRCIENALHWVASDAAHEWAKSA